VSPKISIVLCTYNRPEILVNRSIASVLKQTHKNFELNVVGDGPPNNLTKKAMNSINDKRVNYHELPVNGPYPSGKRGWFVAGVPAANKSLELATGKYLSHIDDDDEWYPNHLEKLLALLESNDYDFVYAKTLAKFPGKPNKPNRIIGSPPPIQCGKICHMSILYKAYLKEIQYNLNINEPADWNRFRRIQDSGAKIGFLDDITSIWNASPNRKL